MHHVSSYAVGAFVALLFACGDGSKHDHDNFREDVIFCEDALSYLTTCCPDFNPHVVMCQYHYDYTPGGCERGATTDTGSPALSLEESRCILGRSCDAIRAGGVCERAQKATPYDSHTGGSSGSGTYGSGTSSTNGSHAPVCS